MNKRITLILLVLVSILFVSFTYGDDTPAAADEVDFVIDLVDGDQPKLKEGIWFVEMFAPWCGYCKRLAPIWKDLAADLHHQKSDVKIARVNCDDNSGFCKDYDVKGYPTIKLFVNGVRKDYKGGRTKDIFIKYLEKMMSGYITHGDKSNVESLLKQQPVSFIYVGEPSGAFYDTFNTVSFELYDTTSPNFIVVKDVNDLTESIKTTVPALLVYKDGKYTPFNGKVEDIGKWMKYNQFPTVSEVTDISFIPLVDSFKYLVMFVHDNKASLSEIETMKQLSKAYKTDDQGLVGYAYISKLQYGEWLGRYPELTTLPSVVIVQERGDLYYFDENVVFTDESIKKFITDVVTEKLEVKYVDATKYYFNKFLIFVDEWKWFIAALVVAVPLGSAIYAYRKEEDKETEQEKKKEN